MSRGTSAAESKSQQSLKKCAVCLQPLHKRASHETPGNRRASCRASTNQERCSVAGPKPHFCDALLGVFFAAMAAREWLQRKMRVKDPRNRVLRVTSRGATLCDRVLGAELWSVKWPDVEEIVAFKIDAVVVDHICLGFVVRGSDAMHVTDEETFGWVELNDELARRFGVHFDTWFHAVAFPPFSENRTVLWRAA